VPGLAVDFGVTRAVGEELAMGEEPVALGENVLPGTDVGDAARDTGFEHEIRKSMQNKIIEMVRIRLTIIRVSLPKTATFGMCNAGSP
jgi:hypothetical protein